MTEIKPYHDPKPGDNVARVVDEQTDPTTVCRVSHLRDFNCEVHFVCGMWTTIENFYQFDQFRVSQRPVSCPGCLEGLDEQMPTTAQAQKSEKDAATIKELRMQVELLAARLTDSLSERDRLRKERDDFRDMLKAALDLPRYKKARQEAQEEVEIVDASRETMVHECGVLCGCINDGKKRMVPGVVRTKQVWRRRADGKKFRVLGFGEFDIITLADFGDLFEKAE